MKRKLLLFTMAAGMGYLSLSSNAAGPAHAGNGIRTGGTGSSGSTCASGGCHSTGAGTTIMEINLTDITNSVDTSVDNNERLYPGHQYKVTVAGGHSPSGLTKYGFQVTATNAAGASTGDLAPGPTASVDDHMVGSFEVIEHTAPITFSSGVMIEFFWTAPSSFNSVKFDGILNATNGDNTIGGDKPSAPYTKSYNSTTNSISELPANIRIAAYPNPAKNNFSLKFDNAVAGDYGVTIYDMSGKKMHSENVTVGQTGAVNIQANNWAAGMYLTHITKDGAQRVLPVVIQ